MALNRHSLAADSALPCGAVLRSPPAGRTPTLTSDAGALEAATGFASAVFPGTGKVQHNRGDGVGVMEMTPLSDQGQSRQPVGHPVDPDFEESERLDAGGRGFYRVRLTPGEQPTSTPASVTSLEFHRTGKEAPHAGTGCLRCILGGTSRAE